MINNINKNKFVKEKPKLDEINQDVMLAKGKPAPFELVSQVIKKFGQVFKESSC